MVNRMSRSARRRASSCVHVRSLAVERNRVLPTLNFFTYREPRNLSSVRTRRPSNCGARANETSTIWHHVRAVVKRGFSTAALALLTACYVHTRVHMVAPVIERASLCSEAVRFFEAAGDLSEPYVEVARLSVWWPADMVARVSTVESAIRTKAAKLGANGVIRGRLVGSDTVQPRYQDNVAGTAVFLPRDSARAAAACVSR
jgi:hypothetical protein